MLELFWANEDPNRGCIESHIIDFRLERLIFCLAAEQGSPNPGSLHSHLTRFGCFEFANLPCCYLRLPCRRRASMATAGFSNFTNISHVATTVATPSCVEHWEGPIQTVRSLLQTPPEFALYLSGTLAALQDVFPRAEVGGQCSSESSACIDY